MNPPTEAISEITDFDKLLDLVKVDSGLIDSLSDDQVTALRTRLNPYGRTIEGSGKLTCLSITNLSEQYMKRFLMTSLIGFLYRQCDEYGLDDGEPPTPMDDFAAFTSKLRQSETSALAARDWLAANVNPDASAPPSIVDAALTLEHRRSISRYEGFKARLTARKFIDSIFQYNPDKHVRSAYSDNPLDPERTPPAQTLATPPNTEATPRTSNPSVNHIPPLDTFHRWSYYTDTNYEEIRFAVQDLYCEKPDLEFAINPYDQFPDQEASDKYIQKHKNEVIADVLTLTNGKWNLCGSFKKNRERINFYNEKTGIIEEIFKQIETDKKLGADMMRKRVNRKKQQNIEECGADPVELANYRKDYPSAFETMGAEDVRNAPTSAPTSAPHAVHSDCPYDSVQVDVFDFSRGGASVKKSEFFTQAEAPSTAAPPTTH